MQFKAIVLVLGWSLLTALPGWAAEGETLSSKTSDGVEVFGEAYFGTLSPQAPLVYLYHQAGGDGRAEYADIIPWLNSLGYRVIAWDLRSGGDRFGGVNRTAAGLSEQTPKGYCDAYADLEATLAYAEQHRLADKVVIWGSSYSAALVVQLAARQPEKIAAVLSFSPASGGPMADCRPRQYIDNVTAPMLFVRPAKEMAYQSVIEQQQLLQQKGDFKVVADGVHGSSMLVDSRTKKDMSNARDMVADWLKAQLNGSR